MTPMEVRPRGVPLHWCSPAPASPKPKARYWGSTGPNSPPLSSLQAGSREAGSERSGSDLGMATGLLCRLLRSTTWPGSNKPAGGTLNTERLTSGVLAEWWPPPLTQLQQLLPLKLLQFGRPRSLCAARFQALPSAHPLGPRLARLKHLPARPHHSPFSHPKPAPSRRRNVEARETTSANRALAGQLCRLPGPMTAPATRPRTLKHTSKAPHVVPCVSRTGPKSGCYLLVFCLLNKLEGVVGVRVASTAAVEARPGTMPGKHCSRAQSMPLNAPVPRHAEKRAYRRARLRAAQQGGTMYKGRWHSAAALQSLPYAPSQPVPRSFRRAPQRSSRTFLLRCLSWNAGGLTAGVFQEYMAWIEAQGHYHVCVIQETHWDDSSEFLSGKWACVHSAPPASHRSADRYAGVLVLVSRTHFQDPAVHEVVGGRLVHVRATLKHSGVNVDIVATYQHVWRSHLSLHENRELRQTVWQAMDTTFRSLPSRNILVACGDYNTNLRPCLPHVGRAVGPPTQASSLDDHLSQLLVRHDLCALNSWHATPAYTFTSHTGVSQIDYIITRRTTATGISRQARPLYHFPVAGWRHAGHIPVEAQIPVLPVHWRPGKQQNSAKPIDKARLIQAAADRNQDAEHLQQLVAAKLQDLPLADPHALHDRINAILQASVQQAFPAVAASDNRVSAQEPFRASARFTWQLYRAVRRPRVATAAAILHKWKLCTAFARASAALRHQSRSLKRAAFQSKLAQAEDAATRGDQRTLYQIVRSLGPPSRQHFSRLRNAQGQFLTRGEEAQALVAQGKATYEQLADQPLTAQLYDSLDITDEEITLQLQATKAAKAVPGHLAPAAAWKICASCLGPLLGASLRHHLMQGKAGLLHGDLTDAQMVMLPKAGKSPHLLENLRPIGLMGPPSKALAGALRDRMAAQLQALLRFRPQFAYTAGRGTMNALLRVHMHVAAAARLIRRNQISRCCRHAGQRPLPLGGALSLSLDLSRAFDLADRCCIYATLEKYQVPRSIIDAIQRLHTGSKFVYKAGDRTASFMPTNGLKQGCKIAPCLWVWYTIALFDTLEARLSECWIRTVPTMFADDCWASWLIHSADELRRALKDLQILLCTLEDYKMRINFTKTAVLVKLVGKQASQALCNCTCIRHGVSHLVVVVNGRTQYVPIRTEHEYLGSRVCYDRVADRNLDHRLQAGQLRYHKIQRALTGKHVVSVSHRIRLWAACVFTSTSYSLAAVGLTAQGLHRWETRVLRHLRAIMRKPAHLTHVSNEEIWTQACLQRPGRVILAQLQGLQAQLTARSSCAADITTEQSVRHHVCGLEAHLRQLLEAQNEDSPPRAAATPRFACPHCEDTFLTEHALKIHCGIRHPAPVSEERRPVVQKLNPMEHSIGGLPHCRSCGRKFAKWQNFKHHIESGACEAMGGSSFVHKPPAEVEMKAAVPAPALPPVAHQPPPEQNLPLVERPYFRTSWRNWESLLMNAAIRQELKAHCVLCHFWVADYQHIKQHQRRTHQALQQDVIAICRTFKSQLRSGSNCLWCGNRVWAPIRHVDQCPVLYQLVLAAQYCRSTAADHAAGSEHAPGPERTQLGAQPGDGHLRVRPLCEPHVSTEPSLGPSREPAQQAAASGADPSAPTTPTSGRRTPFWGKPPRDRPGHRQNPGQDCHPTGGPAGGTTWRQRVLSFPARGPRGECATRPDPDLQGLACSPGGGGPGPEISSPNAAAGVPHQETSGADGVDDGHTGVGEKTTGSGVDEPGRGVDLLQVESSGQKTCPRPRPGLHCSAGAAGEDRLLAHQPPRGCGPEVQLPTTTLRDGRQPPRDGDLLLVHLPSRTDRPAGSRAPRSADRGLGPDVSGGLPQTGNSSSLACRATAGGDGLPVMPEAPSPDNVFAGLCASSPPPVPLHLPPFTLVNEDNSCYMNAAVYAVWYVTHCTGTAYMLPPALRTLAGQGMRARRSLGFLLLGWRGARLQHDIAEFLDFILPKVVSAGVSTWSSRSSLPDGSVGTQLTGPLNKCVHLPLPPVHVPGIQELINHWHRQASLHALDRPTPWIFLQLPRFVVSDGEIQKTREPYLLTGLVQLPVFREPGTLGITWHDYAITSYIRHHGPSPTSGHYTTLLGSAPPYLLDDDRMPQKANTSELETTSVSMYILVLGDARMLLTRDRRSRFLGSSLEASASASGDAGDGQLGANNAKDARDLAQQPSGVSGNLDSPLDHGCASASATARSAGSAHSAPALAAATNAGCIGAQQGHE